MPSVRAAHLMLDDVGDEIAFWTWRVAVDLILWLEGTKSPKRPFHVGAATPGPQHFPESIRSEMDALRVIYTDPDRVVASRIADACSRIADWGEKNQRVETALQFAELAARAQPLVSRFCSVAGRLCRRINSHRRSDERELHRATIWFRRATRLASAYSGKSYYRDLASARLGWAYVAQDLGELTEAEQHATKAFRAALRCGRHVEAALAYHALATTLIHQDRLDEAWVHARNAISSYPPGHPRFPALAHDIAFLWARNGFYADAAVLFEKVLPRITLPEERLIVLANIARAGSAAGDHLRFQRAASEILRTLDAGKDVPPTVIYHLARAAVNEQDWSRAKSLAAMLPPTRSSRLNRMTEELLDDIRLQSGRDPNLVPEYGSEVYEARELLLKKLDQHADPGRDFPRSAEKYPIS